MHHLTSSDDEGHPITEPVPPPLGDALAWTDAGEFPRSATSGNVV